MKTPTREWVRKEIERGSLPAGAAIYPCGCGIKLDLEEVVYPVLQKMLPFRGVGERQDAASFSGKWRRVARHIVPVDQIESVLSQVPVNAVLVPLLSFEARFYQNTQESRKVFEKSARSMEALLQKAEKAGKNLSFAKAHTIEAGGDIAILDFFQKTSDDGFTYFNNDTIITADSLLRYDSVLSIRTAIFNALNDLFVSGATKEIKIYPVVAGRKEDFPPIEAELQKIAHELGAQIIEFSPIESEELRLMGASVSASSNKKSRPFSSLQAGDEIYVSRKLGDLSILALHRSLVLEKKEVPQDLKIFREEVLQKFATAQFTIGQLIDKYSAEKNWDTDKHLSFSTDLSGPGLSVLFEAARASKVEVKIEQLNFIAEQYLAHYRRNHTSSTNGPVLWAGSRKCMESFIKELSALGFTEFWRLGHVLASAEEPCIVLEEKLKRFCQENPRLDFFAPEVHFSHEKRRIPIFGNYRFE